MYALVEFDNNSIAVVPLIWVKEEYCYWPNVKDVARLSKAEQTPKEDWKLYKIYIKAVYDEVPFVKLGTYEEAKKNEKKYVNSSNLDSTDSEGLGKGKRKQQKRHEQDSSDDENDSEILPRKQVCAETPEHVPVSRNNFSTVSAINVRQGPSSRLDFPAVPPIDDRPEQSHPEVSPFTISTFTSAPNEYFEVIEPAQPVSSDSSVSRNESVHSKILKEVLHNKLVLKEQGEILSSILTTLNSIHDKLPSGTTRGNETKILPVNLPLQSLEDLLVLEEALNEEGLQDYLCEKISQIGGSSLGNAVRRMLMKLMTNKLATAFSWVGIKGKEPFATLKITSILLGAVRRNPAFSHCSNNDIESVIKDWLRHAKARCKE